MAKTNGSAQSAFQSAFSPFADMTKFMPDFKMPMGAFDVQAMLQAQRRAAETMAEMGQKAFAGMQAVMQRQGEMMRETMQESTGLMSEMMAPGSPEEKVARQSDLARTTFEKCVANSREILDMVAQNNREAADMMSSRMSECMDDMRNACTRRA